MSQCPVCHESLQLEVEINPETKKINYIDCRECDYHYEFDGTLNTFYIGGEIVEALNDLEREPRIDCTFHIYSLMNKVRSKQ